MTRKLRLVQVSPTPSDLQAELLKLVQGLDELGLDVDQARQLLDYATPWTVAYYRKGNLQDFQLLCHDLGITGDLGSLTKCRKALARVHVNIKQFIGAKKFGGEIKHFKNVHAMTDWTRKNKKMFINRSTLPKGCPLRCLLRMM